MSAPATKSAPKAKKANPRNIVNTELSDAVHAKVEADAVKNYRSVAAQVRMIVEAWAAKQPSAS
jgi:hypothetical protein